MVMTIYLADERDGILSVRDQLRNVCTTARGMGASYGVGLWCNLPLRLFDRAFGELKRRNATRSAGVESGTNFISPIPLRPITC
jgi:hypothetical protein